MDWPGLSAVLGCQFWVQVYQNPILLTQNCFEPEASPLPAGRYFPRAGISARTGFNYQPILGLKIRGFI